MTFVETLKNLSACSEAIEWVGDQTLEQAWATCERPDWMFWLACKVGAQRESVLAAADIAERALNRYWTSDDKRPMQAIEAARAWARDPSEQTRAAAYTAAYAAYTAARTAAAAYAADAVTRKESAETIRKHLPIERLRTLMMSM